MNERLTYWDCFHQGYLQVMMMAFLNLKQQNVFHVLHSFLSHSTDNGKFLIFASFCVFQSGALCIHEAARRGHVGLVKMLLEKGVPVDTKNKVKANSD